MNERNKNNNIFHYKKKIKLELYYFKFILFQQNLF